MPFETIRQAEPRAAGALDRAALEVLFENLRDDAKKQGKEKKPDPHLVGLVFLEG